MPRAGLMRPGLAVVLAAIAVAVIIAGCGGDLASTGSEAPAGPIDGGEFESLAEPDVVGEDGLVSRGEDSSLPLTQLTDRKIIRTATLELEVEDVGAAVQRVENVAIAAGGFVSGSSVFIDEPPQFDGEEDVEPRRSQNATVTIRVPAEAYGNVVSQLRGIAHEVKSEISEASEVTEEYSDLQARLRNLEATEARYLELLDRADTIDDILTVQDRVNAVRLEIERVQGSINLLDSLTELATITVQMTLPAAPIEESGGGQGWAAEAWDAAWEASKDTMVALGTVAIVGAVALAWLAIPALVVLIAWRFFGWRPFGVLRRALSEPRRPHSDETGGTGTSA